tara:strand:+ start:647 stop:1006 length:360 start_codon:yes stop_codon:yes gene_type:complete
MIPDVMLREGQEKANRAYNRARTELSGKSPDFLRGYVQAYKDSSALNKVAGWVSLRQRHVRYDVAREMLETQEFEAMPDDELNTIASTPIGFFSRIKTIDRVMKSREIQSRRREATLQD